MNTLERFHVDIRKRPYNKFNPKNDFHKFMELPVKIRKMVYRHALDLGGHLGRVMSAHGTVGEIKARRQPFHLPAICLTSKTESTLATVILFHHAKFSVCCEWCGKKMLSFLHRLPGDFAHAAVRHLIYDHYAKNPSKKDRTFSTVVMQRLPKLERLQIIMTVWDVIELKGLPKSGRYRALTAEEIIKRKDLRPIVKCSALTYLHILVVRAGNLHRTDVMDGFLTIGAQMQEVFNDKGQNPRLRFTHYHRNDPRNDPNYSHRAATAAAATAAAVAVAATPFPIMTSM